ncbi:MAG: vitamin K epoxide reductase family protein [Anaerolineae bacterium]|nr:vitamin K epoxide reductase family protein [Anaerolineae bacterium]MCI0609710.1 vitamin K epoxide reductase family protein [Anaerolineae bacterium]
MDKRLSQLTYALVILGFLVSVYMTIFKITSNENMCIGSKDCSIVNASRYSEINNVPVAVIGVGGYAALLAILFLERRPGFIQQNGTMLFFALSLVGFFFTVYLIFVEIVLIKAYCPFCITSQVAMTLIFILSVIRLIKQP